MTWGSWVLEWSWWDFRGDGFCCGFGKRKKGLVEDWTWAWILNFVWCLGKPCLEVSLLLVDPGVGNRVLILGESFCVESGRDDEIRWMMSWFPVLPSFGKGDPRHTWLRASWRTIIEEHHLPNAPRHPQINYFSDAPASTNPPRHRICPVPLPSKISQKVLQWDQKSPSSLTLPMCFLKVEPSHGLQGKELGEPIE